MGKWPFKSLDDYKRFSKTILSLSWRWTEKATLYTAELWKWIFSLVIMIPLWIVLSIPAFFLCSYKLFKIVNRPKAA